MTFAWPHLLWLLAAPAGLLVWELLRSRRLAGVTHPKILRAEAGLRGVTLSGESAAPLSSRRRLLLCAGIAFGILALARPQWGRIDEPVFDQSREIVIALDLSRSMLTPDVKPSRLERAKLLIESLLDRLHGERVGLVVFSGTAFLQSPVSADYEILREFLPTLGPDFLPEGGTNYRELISTAVEAFGGSSSADRYLIILSDGEATDEDWRDGIGELSKRGIRVIGLGVGTAAGAMIPDGAGAFMKDENGAVVLSKLESGTLRELAGATHGVYRDASQWVDLAQVLASTVEEGRRGRFVERNNVRLVERYQWALAQALICLVACFWLEFPVRPKSREVRLGPPPAPRAPARPLAVAAAAAALLLVACSALAAENASDPAASLSKIVGRLSAQDSCSAQDWSELGRETVNWGQHLRSSGQPVPEGPVRDALAAVDGGSRLDPKASDWDRMRSELEELLQKPEDKKQQDQNQDKNQDKNQDQNQDQKQDQKKDQQQGQDKDQGRDQKQGSPPQSGKPDKSQDADGRQQQRPQGSPRPEKQDAFGDMGKPGTPPPSQNEQQSAMQKVGGPRKDQPKDPARNNPELAVPLEKLEQVRNQDSPGELFQLLRRGEPTPPVKNTGKNW
jgi:Ca-activated chloride channel family protein